MLKTTEHLRLIHSETLLQALETRVAKRGITLGGIASAHLELLVGTPTQLGGTVISLYYIATTELPKIRLSDQVSARLMVA